LDATEVQSGKLAVRCETAGDQDGMGISQVVRYAPPDRRPIIVGGWSKAEHVGAGGDYCLYLSEDYVALLADAQGYEVAKKHVGRLIKTMTEFTRDPAALAAVRDEIADHIEAAGDLPSKSISRRSFVHGLPAAAVLAPAIFASGKSLPSNRVRLGLPSLCIMTLLAAAAQADQRQELTLVRDGKPLATIVVAAEPTVAAAFAVEELRDHVRRITGATLPIVPDNVPVTGPRVLVGRSQATDEVGLPGEPLKPQEKERVALFERGEWEYMLKGAP
jgi:hypothetical protein